MDKDTVIVIGLAGYFLSATPAPARASEPQTKPVASPESGQASKTSESGRPTLSFVKPEGSASANPDETVSIELRGRGVSEVLLGGPEFAESKKSDGTGTFRFQYRVPAGATGTVKLRGFGKTGGGSFVQSDELTINVSLVSAGKVVSMRVISDFVLLSGVGDTRQLHVLGRFSDGVERDITSTSLGTRYTLYPGQPLGSEIVRVDGEGRLTSINAGQRSIAITHKDYSGHAISVRVKVE